MVSKDAEARFWELVRHDFPRLEAQHRTLLKKLRNSPELRVSFEHSREGSYQVCLGQAESHAVRVERNGQLFLYWRALDSDRHRRQFTQFKARFESQVLHPNNSDGSDLKDNVEKLDLEHFVNDLVATARAE